MRILVPISNSTSLSPLSSLEDLFHGAFEINSPVFNITISTTLQMADQNQNLQDVDVDMRITIQLQSYKPLIHTI